MNNSGAAIRHKLYDFIRVADNKKLTAIYNLLENEIEQTNEWWKNKSFTAELIIAIMHLKKVPIKVLLLPNLNWL